MHPGVRTGGFGSTSSRACRLVGNLLALGLDDLTFWFTELWDHWRTLLFQKFCDFFTWFRAAFQTAEQTYKSSQNAMATTLFLSFFFVLDATAFVLLAPLEDAYVQPNRYVDQEKTQVGGGKGSTVCLCKSSHEGERVTGQLSNSTLSRPHGYDSAWPTSKKKRCACALPRGPQL